MNHAATVISKELFTAARSGDAHAFERIVFHFQRKIYHFISGMVGHQHAEDLMQETFLKLFRNIQNYDPRKEHNAWVYTIARTTVYDWLRKERKRTDYHIINDDNNGFEPSDEVPGHMLTEEQVSTRIDMHEALEQLPFEQKEALVLYYWSGYTYKEIAEILDKPINTVKTLLHRAKLHMRAVLEPNPDA